MKVVLLDDSRKRNNEIGSALEERRHDVVSCAQSGEFMEKVETEAPDRIVLDVSSWYRGKPIYTYFDFQKKMAGIPVVFYNAPESFTGLPDRENQQDLILKRPVENNAIIEACR